MEHARLSALAVWESFYVIVGSSAAALTGLQFVVIVLGAEMNAIAAPAARAFATPTIVHFCAVLLVSAVLSAPWNALSSAAVVLGACGATGVLYAIRVIVHARRQKEYVPVAEDWLWYFAFPLVAYTTLLISAITLQRNPASSLFVIGATAVLLLFIGIHNAWDAVMYIAIERHPRKE
jgi:hypothetical protein